MGNNFLEKGALELGIEGWVGEYLSGQGEGIPGRGGMACKKTKAQRYVMCGKSLVELIIRGWGKTLRKERNRSGKASGPSYRG